MDNKAILVYRVKKYLKILLIALLFLLLGLLIYEYIRVKPNDVHFTNVTSSSVTVSWTTKSPMEGFAVVVDERNNIPIKVFPSKESLAFDTRDVRKAELETTLKTSGKIAEGGDLSISMDEVVSEVKIENFGKYYTHHVEITDLNPDTSYKILIGDGMLFTQVKDLNDIQSVKTSSIPESIPAPIPAYGSIKDADGKDLPIENLLIVTDATVYFNYFEELSGERSSQVSGTLNENGNWYLDVSGAVDQEGNLFMAKYGEDSPNNLFAELVIEAGPLGKWKKQISVYESSPAEMIVLNMPNASENSDSPDALQKLESSNSKSTAIKGVNAMEPGCVFISYCGCGKSVDYTWVDCDCDENTLEARGCTTQQSANDAVQEVTTSSNQCSGGGVEGATLMWGTECKTCQWNSTHSYLLWVYTPGVCAEDAPSGVPQNPEPDPVNPEAPNSGDTAQSALNEMHVGEPCTVNGKSGVVDFQHRCIELTGDRDEIVMDGKTVRVQCTDPNGCTCIYNHNSANEERSNVNFNTGYCQVRTGTAVVVDPVDTAGSNEEEPANNFYNLPGCVECHEPEPVECTNCHDTSQTGTGVDFESYIQLARHVITLTPTSTPNTCTYQNDGDMCLCYTNNAYGDPVVEEISNGSRCEARPVAQPVPTPVPTPKKVLAQEDAHTYEDYIIDTKNSSISILAPGEYIFKIDGETYFLSIDLEDIYASNGNIVIYVDSNANGKLDLGEDTKISDFGAILKVSTIDQTYIYNLKAGYNFISMPFIPIPTEQRTAAGLLASLNDSFNGGIFSISKYDSNWKVVGQNSAIYDNNDFQILPGQGYIIKVEENKQIAILGQPIKFENENDVAPILLSEGWNLIGLYGTNAKSYTAKSLIQSINSFSGINFTSDNVTRWESDAQKYDGYILENENGIDMEYGFDFPIDLLQGYFVRVQEGNGNWQPELK